MSRNISRQYNRGTQVVRITFIEANGCEHTVDAEPGLSLMEAAKNNGVPGILADCGGNCACGTCRVYVDETWRLKLGDASEMEAATIEAHEDALPGKRLSCQVPLTAELDGLVVRLPQKQF